MDRMQAGSELDLAASAVRRLQRIVFDDLLVIDEEPGTVVGFEIELIFAGLGDVELTVVIDAEPLQIVSYTRNARNPWKKVLVDDVERVGVDRADRIEIPKIGQHSGAIRDLIDIAAECVRERDGNAEGADGSHGRRREFGLIRRARNIHDAQVAGLMLAHYQPHEIRRLAGDFELRTQAVNLGIRGFRGSELAVGGGVKVLFNIAGGIVRAHAQVEVDLRVGSVEADPGQRFGTDDHHVLRRFSARHDNRMRRDGERGWKQGMEARGVR